MFFSVSSKPPAALLRLLALLLLALRTSTFTVTELRADDPDESELAFAEGDTLSIRFSAPTGAAPGDGLDREAIHELVAFSSEVSGDYWAYWNTSQLLVLTFGLVDAASAPPVGAWRVECVAAACAAAPSPPLVGAWGYRAPATLAIDALVAADADDADVAFSAGDTLTVRFAEPTDRAGAPPGARLGHDALLELLELRPEPHGANLSAAWSDDGATLTIDVHAAGDAASAPALGAFTVAVRAAALLRDAAGSRVHSEAVSPPLTGDWGRPPALVDFVAADPDDGDDVLSAGDTLTLTFDKLTDGPSHAAVATRVELDQLVHFSQALGQDYTGAWADATTLVVTVAEPRGATAALGSLTATLRGGSLPGATTLRNAQRRCAPSASTSPPLRGNWGRVPSVSALRPAWASPGGARVTVLGRGFDGPRAAAPRCEWFEPRANASANATASSGGGDDAAGNATAAAPPPPPPAEAEAVSVAEAVEAGPAGIVCETPPASYGALNLSLGYGGGSPPSSPLAVALGAPPTLSSVQPVAGPWRGGTAITLRGDLLAAAGGHTSLLHSARCRFGDPGAPAAALHTRATWHGDDTLVCASPAWRRDRWPAAATPATSPTTSAAASAAAAALSSLPLTLLYNGVDPTAAGWRDAPAGEGGAPRPVAADPFIFTHFDQKLSSVVPAAGPRSAPTAITVRGRGLSLHSSGELGAHPSLCRIGDVDTPTLRVNGSDGIVVCQAAPCDCTAAIGDAARPACCGAVPLEVRVSTNGGADWAAGRPPVHFAYYEPPVVSALDGDMLRGPPDGGVPVTLTGAGFARVGEAALSSLAVCRFGETVVPALRAADRGVVCVSPPARAGTVAVSAAPNGAHFFPEAPPLPAFGFTTACAGYMTPALCVADPGCGWCDGGVDKHDSPEGYGACVECDSGGGACSGGALGPLACDLAAPWGDDLDGLEDGKADCGRCPFLSRKQPLTVQTAGVSHVVGELAAPAFALFQIDPPHSNFAIRLSLESAGNFHSAGLLLRARKDMPPLGNQILGAGVPWRDEYEVEAGGTFGWKELVVPEELVTCGQRLSRRANGSWPDLLMQSADRRWAPLDRELVGANTRGRWWGGGAPACDAWFVQILAESPIIPENDGSRPPAPYDLRVALEPHYASFACADCAPPPPPPPSQFSRWMPWPPPPPPPVDRHGRALSGDCEACGMRFHGTTERAADDVHRQVLRLVHSVAPKAPSQAGSLWYGERLNVADGFDASFEFRFSNPSTCAAPYEIVDSPYRTAEEAYARQRLYVESNGATGAPVPNPQLPLPVSRTISNLRAEPPHPSSCASGAPATFDNGGVGGEGLAFVVHDDPSGTAAEGCAGPGLGYAADNAYYTSCQRRIRNSIAVQLVAFQNVSQPRIGGNWGRNVTDTVEWLDSDTLGIYLHGDNGRPLAATAFGRADGRRASLLDGEAHHVRVRHTMGVLSVYLDHEEAPALQTHVDLAIDAGIAAADAWVGFTAATGVASMDADVLSFAFCQWPHCGGGRPSQAGAFAVAL